jgi:serine/threonine protein kinase
MAEAALKSDVSPSPADTGINPLAPEPAPEKPSNVVQQAKQEIEGKMRAYKPSFSPNSLAPDLLNGSYHIKIDQPLPEFSRTHMSAFAVADATGNILPYFAAICDYGLPYRHTSMEKLLGIDHPNLVRLVDHGIVHLSNLNEQRHVLLFEKPQGQSLSTLLAEGLQFNEQKLHEQILTPLSNALSSLDELGISHCSIHPNNIYLGEKLVLGECISLPAGFSQEFIYEPVERISAIPQGKGAGSLKVDVYAIGVLVIEILHNLSRLRGISQDQLISLLLQQGCYNTLIGNGEFSEYFHDLLRGSLCDDPADRWGAAQLAQWITGKRFNIIHPSTPREASRPFTFDGKDYFNRKSLSHALYTNWETAKNFVRGAKIERWLEQSIQLPDDGALVNQIINISGSSGKNAKRANEVLTRLLIVLDPSGPIRTEHLAFNTDAIGKMLSEAMYNKRHNDLNLLVEVMLNDLPHYWTERQKTRQTQEAQDAVWKIQSSRSVLTNPSFGFGVERCLYDLNHDLPCYSPQLKGRYITGLQEFMLAIDALAAEHPGEFTLLDRHLMAFATSRAKINNDIRFTEIGAFAPELAQSKELHVLQLIAKAQSKSNLASLPGLSYHSALMVLGLLDKIHSRKIRETLVQRVRQVSENGSVQAVLNVLLDTTFLERDRTGYNNAREMFLRNQLEINKLRDRDELKKKVRDRSQRWASLASMFIFLITCAFVVRDLIGH